MEMFDENHQYISLANKYRPQKFEDMVGQESISKTLQNALKLGRIGHAYFVLRTARVRKNHHRAYFGEGPKLHRTRRG